MPGPTMNAHVLKYILWQHFMATRQHRVLAICYWDTEYRMEKKDA